MQHTGVFRALTAIGIAALLGLCSTVAASSQTAPTVTNIQAAQHDGQTFITWTDAASGQNGANYRYDLYRSTSGPITDLSSATLVQQGIYNNSGQLIGPKPFNQATRQNTSLLMSKIQNGGSALPVWSGIAVCTNQTTGSAYYAVITRDTTNQQQPSPLSAGNNSMQSSIGESPAPIQPVLQVPSTDNSRDPACCSISGKPNLPLWLKLHGSGGIAAPWGDLQAYWGDSTMGYQDGIQSMFSLYEDHSGNGIAKGGVRQLIMSPQDAVWSINGNALSETFWYGYRDVPIFGGNQNPYVYPFTQSKFALILPWAIQHYAADSNHIYGVAESMGGYGQVNWFLRQGNVFAAIFLRIPVLGPWLHIPSLIDVTRNGTPTVVATPTDTLPDGKTLYNDASNSPAWVAEDCSRDLPYVSWSSGRNDATLANHAMWSDSVQMANVLEICHYGFSLIWGDGGHDNVTAGLENTLLEQYQTVFAKNVSYPAFTSFSLDSNYGNGERTNGDPSGCVNCGWQWNLIGDTGTSWSASFSNSQVTSQAIVNVTPRNAQSFRLTPGTQVSWSTSTNQRGKVNADSYGLVTVPGINLASGGATTLTITNP